MIRYQLVLFQVVVAIGWLAAIVWFFLLIAGMAVPVSALAVTSYWGGLLAGPTFLFIGSVLLLSPVRNRPVVRVLPVVGALLVAVQSLVWIAPSLRRWDTGSVEFALGAALVVASIATVPVSIALHRWVRPSRQSSAIT